MMASWIYTNARIDARYHLQVELTLGNAIEQIKEQLEKAQFMEVFLDGTPPAGSILSHYN